MPERLDLNQTVRSLERMLTRVIGEDVELTTALDPGLQPVLVDPGQIEQVVLNLALNARDAMRDGGTLAITTANFRTRVPWEHPALPVRVPPGEWVRLSVRDTGCGMDDATAAQAYEPFFTTKDAATGSGLGLSMVYGIVKQTGGYIFCDSILGRGTTFALFFPAHEAGTGDVAEPAPAVVRPERGLRLGEGVVLLVEDEAPVRAFASRALTMRGYKVIEAENAEEALRLLADRALAVDVFVTDVIMPGMDGPTWVREALKDRPDTRVVFVSGYSEESLSEERDRIPNSVFLPKPFSLSELTATVQSQLH